MGQRVTTLYLLDVMRRDPSSQVCCCGARLTPPPTAALFLLAAATAPEAWLSVVGPCAGEFEGDGVRSDVTGLGPQEMKGLLEWRAFYHEVC